MTTITRLAVLVLALGVAVPVTAQVTDLAPWGGVWIKAKFKQKGSSFRVGEPGVGKDKGGGTTYLQLQFDAGQPDRLQMDVWVNEEVGWELQESFPVLYLAGVTEDVVVYFNQIPVTPAPVVDPLLHLGLVMRLQGKVSGEAVTKGSLKTLGGVYIEIDDVVGSNERFAGKASLAGNVTKKLPDGLPQN